jgi:tetratricopeptide (TPR) repeat protein
MSRGAVVRFGLIRDGLSTMPAKRLMKNTKNLGRRLSNLLVERDLKTGIALLDRHFSGGLVLDRASTECAEFLFILAQWVDLGFRDISFLEFQLTPFQTRAPRMLRVSQFVALKLTESYVELSRRRYGRAVELLEAVLCLYGEVLTPHQRFVNHLWLTRAQRQAGNFEQAYAEIRLARQQAEAMRADKLEAVAKIHESWLVFYRGDRRTAFQLLDEAERALEPTGHTLSLGNIAAARGRFIRSIGDYERALSFFEQAVEIYRGGHPTHPNLARALVNAAYVKRLMALGLRSRSAGKATAAIHSRALRTASEAMELLRTAGKIYAQHQHQSGTGSVLINLGHLKLESGEIESASEESDAAFALSQQKNDAVLMARARILQAYIEMARSEEQLDDSSDPLSSSQRALQFAEDAVHLAENMQNRRLLAGAYITHGLTLTGLPEADWDLAGDRAEQAAELLRDQDRDHLFRELSGLRSRIAQPATAEGILKRWMNGDLGARSFRQAEEEFAQIVIPRVWMRMGRNISRVAKELNVSPKKVRRAIRNAQTAEDVRAPGRAFRNV